MVFTLFRHILKELKGKKTYLIIVVAIVFILICFKTIRYKRFKDAEERAIWHFTNMEYYSYVDIKDSHYNPDSKIYDIYVETLDDKKYKLSVDMTSKDNAGNYNKITIQDCIE